MWMHGSSYIMCIYLPYLPMLCSMIFIVLVKGKAVTRNCKSGQEEFRDNYVGQLPHARPKLRPGFNRQVQAHFPQPCASSMWLVWLLSCLKTRPKDLATSWFSESGASHGSGRLAPSICGFTQSQPLISPADRALGWPICRMSTHRFRLPALGVAVLQMTLAGHGREEAHGNRARGCVK